MPDYHQISVPQLGEGMQYATVVRILKKAGDWVDEDSDLIEIETDKATYEVPSPASGYISNILCETGQQLKVGDIILELSQDFKKASNSVARTKQQRRKDRLEGNKSHQKTFLKLPLTQLQLIEKLKESNEIIIPATVETQIDWEKIEDLRKQIRTKHSDTSVPSALEILTYCTSKAMLEFEKFRAKLNHNLELEIKDESHIGIAVSLPDDILVTPSVVIDELDSSRAVMNKLRNTVNKIKTNKSQNTNYHSLTISSMSAQGITAAKPVVVYPAVATLFIGKPYYSQIEKDLTRKMCNLSLTFDHRVLNGDYAAKFLRQISKNLKNYEWN